MNTEMNNNYNCSHDDSVVCNSLAGHLPDSLRFHKDHPNLIISKKVWSGLDVARIAIFDGSPADNLLFIGHFHRGISVGNHVIYKRDSVMPIIYQEFNSRGKLVEEHSYSSDRSEIEDILLVLKNALDRLQD